jgi:hypothetical protein
VKIIASFIKNNPRNKLVISSRELENFEYLDVGLELSKVLSLVDLDKVSTNQLLEYFDGLVKDHVFQNRDFGYVLALKNVGILFEPQLVLNFTTFVERTSQNVLVVLNWRGVVDGKKLYFLSKENGLKIDLDGLNIMTI